MNFNSESEDYKNFEKFTNWIEKSINPDVDPCEDFIEYSCGKYSDENFDETQGEYCQFPFGDPFDKLLKNQTIDSAMIRKVRDFCNSLPSNPRTILQNEGIIEFCGGFPAFYDDWTSENFDWIKAAAILNAFDLDILLTLLVDYWEEGNLIIVSTIEPEEAKIENAEEILRKFELSEEIICDIINDVNTIKERIDAAIISRDSDGSLLERVRRTFAELRDDPFDYRKYFESYLGYPLRDDDIFHLNYEEPGYLDRFLNIFAEVSPKTVANYITFMALCHDDSDRSYWRLWLATRHFAPIFLSEGFATYCDEIQIENRKNVLERFINSFERHSEEIEIDRNDYPYIFANKDREILEYIKENFNKKRIEEEYAGLEISSDNFFQNIINIGRQGPPPSLRKCFSYAFEDQKVFRETKDLLEFFINHHKKPLMYYFPCWYSGNWEKIICEAGIENNIKNYQIIKDYIKNQIKSYNRSEDEEDDNSEFIDFWIEQYISTIEKLKRSYEDYVFWLTENEDKEKMQDEILKRLNLNSRKAFFVCFVQQYCYLENENRTVLILALLNSEEFAKEFDCKPYSRMYPKEKCDIKWNKSKTS